MSEKWVVLYYKNLNAKVETVWQFYLSSRLCTNLKPLSHHKMPLAFYNI